MVIFESIFLTFVSLSYLSELTCFERGFSPPEDGSHPALNAGAHHISRAGPGKIGHTQWEHS